MAIGTPDNRLRSFPSVNRRGEALIEGSGFIFTGLREHNGFCELFRQPQADQRQQNKDHRHAGQSVKPREWINPRSYRRAKADTAKHKGAGQRQSNAAMPDRGDFDDPASEALRPVTLH